MSIIAGIPMPHDAGIRSSCRSKAAAVAAAYRSLQPQTSTRLTLFSRDAQDAWTLLQLHPNTRTLPCPGMYRTQAAGAAMLSTAVSSPACHLLNSSVIGL